MVYAVDYVNYDETGKYRYQGASRAAKYGAIGCLVRSITPYSIESPHTGKMIYDE